MPQMPRVLQFPRHLQDSVWSHVLRELPRECVGVLGAEPASQGNGLGETVRLRAVYPLRNIAGSPERRYLADPLQLMRALRAMPEDGLVLAAIYHSHPKGPAVPSRSDLLLAEYPVPYLIADVTRREFRAYLLPENIEVEVQLD